MPAAHRAFCWSLLLFWTLFGCRRGSSEIGDAKAGGSKLPGLADDEGNSAPPGNCSFLESSGFVRGLIGILCRKAAKRASTSGGRPRLFLEADDLFTI